MKENSIPRTQPARLYFSILSDSLHECFMVRKMQFVRYGFRLSYSSIFLFSDFERNIEKLMGLTKYYYFCFCLQYLLIFSFSVLGFESFEK